jgi:hypothetical protein
MHESENPAILEIPPLVQIEKVMNFLQRGHGYFWSIVSRGPIPMLLGHPPRSGLPEIVVVNRTIYAHPNDPVMKGRLDKMLQVLDRKEVSSGK